MLVNITNVNFLPLHIRHSDHFEKNSVPNLIGKEVSYFMKLKLLIDILIHSDVLNVNKLIQRFLNGQRFLLIQTLNKFTMVKVSK